MHVKDAKGRSTLHLAAARGRLDIVEYLWSKSIDLEDEDVNGRTPLQLAAANGHADCVSFLIGKGAFISTIDNVSMNPLHMAALRGHLNVLQVIMDSGDSKTHMQINDLGLTPLGVAAMSGHAACVSYLITKEDGNAIESESYFSALHAACLSRDVSVVSLVLDSAHAINCSNNPSKVTPLHCAAYIGDKKILKRILEAYPTKEALDCHGNTAMWYVPAECVERQEILKLLETEAGPKVAKLQNKLNASNQKIENAEDAFSSFEPSEQRRKVKHWTSLALDDPLLLRSIGRFEQREEIVKWLKRAKDLIQKLKVHDIYSHLRQDEEFQEDMRDPSVAKTVDALRKDPSQYEHYQTKLRIGSVLEKMKIAHGELKGVGEQNLMLDYALIKGRMCEVKAEDESKKMILLDQIARAYEKIEALCQENCRGGNNKLARESEPSISLFSWQGLLLMAIIAFIAFLLHTTK